MGEGREKKKKGENGQGLGEEETYFFFFNSLQELESPMKYILLEFIRFPNDF